MSFRILMTIEYKLHELSRTFQLLPMKENTRPMLNSVVAMVPRVELVNMLL